MTPKFLNLIVDVLHSPQIDEATSPRCIGWQKEGEEVRVVSYSRGRIFQINQAADDKLDESTTRSKFSAYLLDIHARQLQLQTGPTDGESDLFLQFLYAEHSFGLTVTLNSASQILSCWISWSLLAMFSS